MDAQTVLRIKPALTEYLHVFDVIGRLRTGQVWALQNRPVC